MSSAPNAAYQNLKDRFQLLSGLEGAGEILGMDSATVMKPGSEADRSEQMMALASASQKLLNDPAVKDWLDEAESKKDTLSAGDQRNLSLMRREWISSNALPEALVREQARLESEGNNLHTEYRDKGDWKIMQPVYEAAFRVSREVGDTLKGPLGFATPYEALVDQFSPGLSLATIEKEFAKLEAALPGLIAETIEKQKLAGPALILPPVPIEILKVMGNQLMIDMGFDENRGILYTGDMHPFMGGTPDDTRLTTHYNPLNPLDGLYTVLHEAGHALYEQGTPIDWRYQPAGHTMGMNIHESQSMIMELQAARIPEFFDYLSDRFINDLQEKNNTAALTAENLRKTWFKVEPSFIRIYADEMTYPAHIVLRFNLERDIIAGKLDVKDLPDAWNAGMKKLLGIVPPGPAQGHMQDVHWPTLSVGYFPAYTFGAMGAAQFFAAAVKAKPEIPGELGKGQFKTLLGWLRENVHSKGSLLTQDQLFTAATGEALNANYFLNSLSRRYLGKDYTP